MLRHLLLALFLIGLSLPAMTVPAQAGTAPIDCHGMPPSDHHPDRDAGKAAGHMCIGCVASPALPSVETPIPLPAAAAVAQPVDALAGADTPPGIPPPRA